MACTPEKIVLIVEREGPTTEDSYDGQDLVPSCTATFMHD